MRRSLLLWGALATAGALVAILFFVDPTSTSLFPRCPFNLLTGLYCPGCGTLRGLHQLMHGDLLTALDLNAFMVVALPPILWWTVSRLLQSSGAKPLPMPALTPPRAWGILTLVLAFWVARNVPVSPLDVLAP